jgi:hypothetical protein
MCRNCKYRLRYRQIVRASAVAAGALFILRSVGDGANELAGKSRDPVDCVACTLYERVLGLSEYWTWMIDTEVVSCLQNFMGTISQMHDYFALIRHDKR